VDVLPMSLAIHREMPVDIALRRNFSHARAITSSSA
jgi:hypothetical protein